jgi:hypothetical protein
MKAIVEEIDASPDEAMPKSRWQEIIKNLMQRATQNDNRRQSIRCKMKMAQLQVDEAMEAYRKSATVAATS